MLTDLDNTHMWGGATVAQQLSYAFGGTPESYQVYDGTDGCYSYIGMGIGDDSELIGKGLQSAPVLFVPNGDFNPEKAYSRFIAIFKVQASENAEKDCSDQAQPASFVGAVANMDFGRLIGSAASQQWSSSSARMNN